MLKRVCHWVTPSPRGEVRYRSPDEIALENAAEALGVHLADDYLEDFDLPDDSTVRLDKAGNADRLDASREEMLAYIQRVRGKRRRLRRRRRQRAALALTAVMAVVVFALEFERHEPTTSPSGKDDGRKLAQGIWTKLSPNTRKGRGVANPAAPSVMTEMSADVGRIISTSYLDIRDEICMSFTHLVRGVTKQKGVGSCVSPRYLRAELSRVPAFYSFLSADKRYVLLHGHGRADLKRIVARTPGGRVDVKISSTWDVRPKTGGRGFSLKLFLVRVWYGHGVSFESALGLASDSSPIDLLAVFGNGQVSRILTSDEVRRERQRLIDPQDQHDA